MKRKTFYLLLAVSLFFVVAGSLLNFAMVKIHGGFMPFREQESVLEWFKASPYNFLCDWIIVEFDGSLYVFSLGDVLIISSLFLASFLSSYALLDYLFCTSCKKDSFLYNNNGGAK